MDPARMPMTRRSPGQVRAALRLLRWLVVAGVTTGACVGLALGSRLGTGYVAIGVLKGIGLGGLFALTFGWLEQVALRRLWRRVSLGQAILLRTALYAPLALAVYAAVSIVFSPWIAWSLQRANLLPALAIAALSMLVWSAVVGIGHLIGFRVLGNLLSGRYHRPFEEDRIVLFLDLVGSTTMAERLGHLRYHAFLRDFIADLEEPLLDHGGDVYQYVGDEVVVTWPVADARSNGNCLACYFAIVDAIARSSARYAQLYGAAPSFRTGIHAGPVVAGEIGEWRKQIVFVGDVVNTASRAQALAKERGKDLVVTDAFLARVALPRGTAAISLGVVRPRGKEQSVEFFEIVRSSQP